ncbi:organic cation transporter 1-like [Argiope bruennichi]|uniref:organic cation transporter 1-like n=1 Tax=Argiope bruennichi TaxID=94029 RepID=UPI002495756F|nr:organic cation transporter 1-like [Argiope bruennichi]
MVATNKIEFEDLLEEIGDYGWFQKKMMATFLCPVSMALPVLAMNILFLVNTPDHWCHVPEVARSNLTAEVQKHLFKHNQSSCFMYDLNYTEWIQSNYSYVPDNTPVIPCNNGWEYSKAYFDETAASKWNMVCGDSHYSNLALTLSNSGGAIGTFIYGALGDRIGRRPVFFIIVSVTVVTAAASLLVSNFMAFLVLRTINGGLMSSLFQLPYVIVLELVGPSKRGLSNAIPNISWAVGLCTLPLIAYLSKHWVTLGFVCTSLAVLMFGYWKFLPESPRWYLAHEKYEEAADVLMMIAKTNGKKVERQDILMKAKILGERVQKEKSNENKESSALDLLRYPNLRKKFLIVTFCWAANDLAYYGLQYNLPNLEGNPFLTFFALTIVEFPGLLSIWYLMEKFGRRWSSASFLGLAGFACLVVAVVPEDVPHVAVICSVIGKFGSTSSFMAIYLQSSELYPTPVRSVAMGITGAVGCAAIVVAPYIVYLAVFGKYIPFLVIGLTAVLASFSGTFLPETLDEILPQTIQDGETFGKNQKYFSCTRKRRRSSPTEEQTVKA